MLLFNSLYVSNASEPTPQSLPVLFLLACP